jgi:hypothetical protein
MVGAEVMKYYKDKGGNIYAFEADGSQDAFISSDLALLDAEGLAKARKAQEDANAPTPEQLIASVNAQRDSLLAAAALRIAPLQYAVDLGMSTDLEKANLLDWMRYSVSLNRIEQQPEYPKTVSWPIAPGGF